LNYKNLIEIEYLNKSVDEKNKEIEQLISRINNITNNDDHESMKLKNKILTEENKKLTNQLNITKQDMLIKDQEISNLRSRIDK